MIITSANIAFATVHKNHVNRRKILETLPEISKMIVVARKLVKTSFLVETFISVQSGLIKKKF